MINRIVILLQLYQSQCNQYHMCTDYHCKICENAQLNVKSIKYLRIPYNAYQYCMSVALESHLIKSKLQLFNINLCHLLAPQILTEYP